MEYENKRKVMVVFFVALFILSVAQFFWPRPVVQEQDCYWTRSTPDGRIVMSGIGPAPAQENQDQDIIHT